MCNWCEVITRRYAAAGLHPERFTRSFQGDVARCRKATGEETLPVSGFMICGTPMRR